ncbi:hypothetical protein FXN65_15280 [Metapseudomonas lalkuanensis]|uniref:Uncharacterized protein n=1 Tax=Metapseudomonas lalkuanensis TaxID=2604832 RepID=A0A5J6QLW2_9GAMM|nr:hypothetical protein [Pseudomonas lalkuanensis]QEY63347.1 hypothetical protein FXN65_15280 [Pseudomonas lalkuanensis]
MKQIVFPGHDRQPCEALYGLYFEPTTAYHNVHVVVVQTASGQSNRMGTSLFNTDDGRDNVLNRIIEAELNGVRLDFIRFHVILDFAAVPTGSTWPIHLDVDKYLENGNPYEVREVPAQDLKALYYKATGRGGKEYSFNSFDVVGGSAPVFTRFEEGTTLSLERMKELLAGAGYTSASNSNQVTPA